ncbi:MAG: PASTA domain-containing protein, partial [Clostridiales bacterium]|nr:PASTA domain-containing protein [Clostridiales bacterium]
MLTGIVPEDAMERMDDDYLQPISKLAVYISKNQEKVIFHALTLSVKDRTQTIEEFENELKSQKAGRQPKKEPEDKKSYGGLFFGAGAGIIIIAAVVIGFYIMGNRSSTKTTVDADNNGRSVTDSFSLNPDNSDDGEAGEASQIIVPNLINYDKDTAEAVAQGQGFTLNVVDTENSTEIEKGKIISQSPEAGVSSSSGNINVVVSAGKDTVALTENLLGYDSLDTLKSDGFILTTEETKSYLIPGYVVSIERNSGTDDEDNNEDHTVETGDQLPE